MKNLIINYLSYFSARILKVVKHRNNFKEIDEFKKNLIKEDIITDYTLSLKSLPIIKKYPKSILKFGQNCIINNNSDENIAGISSPTILSTVTEKAKLIIGNHVGFSGNFICCSNEIIIGNYVNFGAGAKVYDTDFHPINFAERRKNPGFDLNIIPNAPIRIGNDVWLGCNVIILKGVVLGERVIVAAGSIVTKSFPSDVIIGGNPAKIIKHLK